MQIKFTEEYEKSLKDQILKERSKNIKGYFHKFKNNTEFIEFLNWKFPQLVNEPFLTKLTWFITDIKDYPICPTCHKKYGFGMKIRIWRLF